MMKVAIVLWIVIKILFLASKNWVLMEDSLTVYSSKCYSYMQHNSILFYFCTAFTTYQLLESYASGIALNHAGNLKCCGSAACVTGLTRNSNNSSGNAKEPPLLKASYYLAEGFKHITKGNDNES